MRTRWPWSPIVAALLVLTLALGACDDDDGGDIEDASEVDPAELLSAAADRMEAMNSFHFVLEHENGATEIVLGIEMRRAEGDVDGAERLAAEIDASVGPLNIEVGVVVLEDESWITNPLTGRWEREDFNLADVFDPTSGVTSLLRSAANPSIAERTSIDGEPAWRVDATIDSGDLTFFSDDPVAGRSLPASAWIGVEDPVVYRLEVTGPVAEGDAEDIVRRIELSRFDEDVTIEPPR